MCIPIVAEFSLFSFPLDIMLTLGPVEPVNIPYFTVKGLSSVWAFYPNSRRAVFYHPIEPALLIQEFCEKKIPLFQLRHFIGKFTHNLLRIKMKTLHTMELR